MKDCITVQRDNSSQCPPSPPSPPTKPACPANCGQQEYVLSEGKNIYVEPGQEIRQDFILQKNHYDDCGTISGFVKDKNGQPIENALVKVFDKHHHPLYHVFTNKEGQFLICVPPGQYVLKAVR